MALAIHLRRFAPRYTLGSLFVITTLLASILSSYNVLFPADPVDRPARVLSEKGAFVHVFTDLRVGQRLAWVKLDGLTLTPSLSDAMCELNRVVPVFRLQCDRVAASAAGQQSVEDGTVACRDCWSFLSHLNRLESMSARSSDIRDDEVLLLETSRVREVLLHDSQIAFDKAFKGFQCVEKLDLAGTQVSDMSLANLILMPNLRSLCLDNTAVSDRGVAHLALQANLEELGLSQTTVSDEGIELLQGMHRLEVIDVSDTDVTVRGIRTLRAMQVTYIYAGAGLLTRDELCELAREYPGPSIIEWSRESLWKQPPHPRAITP